VAVKRIMRQETILTKAFDLVVTSLTTALMLGATNIVGTKTTTTKTTEL
jgi:hypothetical protein